MKWRRIKRKVRRMFHVKRSLAVLLSALVLTISIGASVPAPRSQAAMLPAAVGAWEVFQWLLISAGVTITGYELIESVAPEGWKDDVMDAVTESLNAFKTKLGDDIRTVANVTSATALTSVTVARETWHDLVAWAKSLFATSEESEVTGSSGVSVQLSSVEQLSSITQKTSGHGLNVNSSIYRNYAQNFMTYAASYNAPITIFLLMPDVTKPDKYQLYYMFNEDGTVAVPQFDNVSQWGYGLLRSSGKNFNCYKLTLDSTGQYWTGSYGSSSQKFYTLFDCNASAITYPDAHWKTLLLGASVYANAMLKVYPPYLAHAKDDELVIVGPKTKLQDGVLVGDVVLPFPAAIDDVLAGIRDGVIDIPDALEDVDVWVGSKEDTKALEDALEKAEAGAGTAPNFPAIDNFAVPLAEYFPFCLPFDFVNFISCLKADPVAPEVTFPFPVGYDLNSGIIYQTYTISLAQFDTVAQWLRVFELLAFIIGLTFVTRSMFIRG